MPQAQWEDALGRANYIRLKRSDEKKRLHADGDRGESAQRVIDLLMGELPDYMRTMRVGDLLVVIPRVGIKAMRKLLSPFPISESRTLEALTDRQRGQLVGQLARIRDGYSRKG